jgi:hypothetical protein
MKKFIKSSIVALALIIVAYLVFFSAITPYIRGVVIDKETKKPVENAWVMAVAGTTTLTVAGDVSSYHLITRPHTRTDKNGRFSIPPRMFFSFPPPLTFGMYKSELQIDIYAPGGKRGAVDVIEVKRAIPNPVPQDEEASISAWPIVKNAFLSVFVPVKNISMTQEQIKKELGWLGTYCDSGRYYFARPFIEGGCDSWELGYLIDKVELLQAKLTNPKNASEIAEHSNGLQMLAYLYKRKGDYRKALELYLALYEFDTKHGMKMELKNYKKEIEDLRKESQDKQSKMEGV